MIDIWLIFAQMIPFFEVLLHTFIDVMRVEGNPNVLALLVSCLPSESTAVLTEI